MKNKECVIAVLMHSAPIEHNVLFTALPLRAWQLQSSELTEVKENEREQYNRRC